MDPWIAIVVGTLTSAIVTFGFVWLVAGRMHDRARDDARREYEQNLATMKLEWENREQLLEARAASATSAKVAPARDDVVEARVDLLNRWIGVVDAATRCAAIERPRVARLRFEYQDVFSDELDGFGDYLRRQRVYASVELAQRLTELVERFGRRERELTLSLSEEGSLDDEAAHRAIVGAFEEIATEARELEASIEADCRSSIEG